MQKSSLIDRFRSGKRLDLRAGVRGRDHQSCDRRTGLKRRLHRAVITNLKRVVWGRTRGISHRNILRCNHVNRSRTALLHLDRPNNLAFFEFSKNADKLKADYLKKIEKSEAVLAGLYKELKLILAVNQ